MQVAGKLLSISEASGFSQTVLALRRTITAESKCDIDLMYTSTQQYIEAIVKHCQPCKSNETCA
eukprot:scaffold259755_cov51-Prasinocladus_malaysianus.AAC.1